TTLTGRHGLSTERVERALDRARSSGEPVLLSVTVPWTGLQDPTAVIEATRGPRDPWFAIEQPDRDRFALGALGCVREHEARGPRRFAEIAERWRRLAARAVVAAPPGLPPGAGLTMV